MNSHMRHLLLKGGDDVKRNAPLVLTGLLICLFFLFNPSIAMANTETDAGVGFFGEYPEQPLEEGNEAPILDVLPQTGDQPPLLFLLGGVGCFLLAFVLIKHVKKTNLSY
ncbi:LPXTG cell wall anchor domain-containing protein [Shouchella miscanthi]|uniref:LPXTG cell wall anchor domain-containing protein n=1 Tax=Shouchella miscanthi TaxID=2598861 RepID=A0ABU6NRX3_9BACI|nr:LPXTG cell wall anchor domain-containing protein [Shouchella miscanthi]MED4130005.1 LPXTG cell wall anchor domain-containing protein [Shouchella miscanthi]